MGTNLGESLSSAVDEMHAEGSTQEQETPKKEAPKAKAPVKKPTAPAAKSPAKPAQKPVPAKTEEAPADAEEAPATDETTETEAPAEKEASGPRPWDADLDARGINTPEVQSYMAEVVQPYITRLEQQGTPFQALFEGDLDAAQVAAGVLDELDQDPAGAIVKLINIFEEDNPELVDAINEALGVESEGEPAPEAQAEGDPSAPETQADPLLDRLRQLPEFQAMSEQLKENQAKQEAEQWDNYVASVKEVVPDLDEDLFTLASAAADGDEDAAFVYYNNVMQKRSQENKATPRPTPPPTMGGQGTPPLQPKKQYEGKTGLKDAISDFLEEDKTAFRRNI